MAEEHATEKGKLAMNCTNCGAELEAGARFCRSCGSQVPDTNMNWQDQAYGNTAYDPYQGYGSYGDSAQQTEYDPYQGDPYGPYGQQDGYVQQGGYGQDQQGGRKKKSNTVLVILCVVLVVLILIAAGILIISITDRSDEKKTDSSASAEAVSADESAEEAETMLGQSAYDAGHAGGTAETLPEEPIITVIPSAEPVQSQLPVASPSPSPEVSPSPSVAPSEEPVVDTENELHRYEVVIEDCTWESAAQEAQSRGGYLVRINTEEEFDYLVSNYLNSNDSYSKISFMIGARRAEGSYSYFWTDPAGNTIGDALNSSTAWCCNTWLSGEPTYQDASSGSTEYYLELFHYSTDDRWEFNDVPNDIMKDYPYFSGKLGYIVEYDN